jgi:hypothetical protein
MVSLGLARKPRRPPPEHLQPIKHSGLAEFLESEPSFDCFATGESAGLLTGKAQAVTRPPSKSSINHSIAHLKPRFKTLILQGFISRLQENLIIKQFPKPQRIPHFNHGNPISSAYIP